MAQAIDAEDRARRTISEALHDGALQDLLAVRNELYAMAGQGGDDAAIAATQERLTGIVARLRDVMSALHPTMLQYGGLEAALLAVVEQERGGGEFLAHVTVDPGAAGWSRRRSTPRTAPVAASPRRCTTAPSRSCWPSATSSTGWPAAAATTPRSRPRRRT